jgi:hypothetical protein
MPRKKVTTIDLTPSWEQILPALLMLYVNSETTAGRTAAMEELRRMARLADEHVAASKAGTKK